MDNEGKANEMIPNCVLDFYVAGIVLFLTSISIISGIFFLTLPLQVTRSFPKIVMGISLMLTSSSFTL